MVDDSDRSLVTRPDGSITLAKSKQRFYDVATWSAMAMVSAKQFCELAAKGDPRIVNFNLLDYLFYLQTVFLKFKRFKFPKVLLYDRAYRTMQLQERWTWGTFVPDLFELYLSGNNKPSVSQRQYEAKTRNQTVSQRLALTLPVLSTKAKKIWTCDSFNAGAACTYNPCRFQHRCSLCMLEHPAVKCPTAKPS